MTSLVKKLRIEIEFDCEAERSAVYYPDGSDLWDALDTLWPGLPGIIKTKPTGIMKIGALDIRWECGLEEVAGEGDN